MSSAISVQDVVHCIAGMWHLSLDENKVGETEAWFSAPLKTPQSIALPGTLDDARIGPPPSKAPSLIGPSRRHDFQGQAWYQRDVEIPAAWAGERITLSLERCRWTVTAWLDDTKLGTEDSLLVPHVFTLPANTKPGKHRLTLLIDNTHKIDLGRFVSPLLGGTLGNMNGAIGRLELRATPLVWIESVQVFPNAAKKTARVAVRIGNATGKSGSGELIVETAAHHSLQATWDENGGHAEITVPLGDVKLWDEFSPNLTQLTVRLGAHTRTVRFGVRDFAIRGTQFTLNGRALHLRGEMDGHVFPKTGYPAMEHAWWREYFALLRSYGMNHVRFHSWTPPEAAFDAADELGFIIQAEPPQSNIAAGEVPARDAFVEAEQKRILEIYGNHPSFCLMGIGNEFRGDEALMTRWVQQMIDADPRRLYTCAANARLYTKNRQFTVTPRDRGVRDPGTGRDLRRVVNDYSHPIILHEIGQYNFFPDINEAEKYRGSVFAPTNYELIREDLSKKHLLELAPKIVEATSQHAASLYKEDIEMQLRTPGLAGFHLLGIRDYSMQGTAVNGFVDAFNEPKKVISPEKFREFCGETVPLIRLGKRVFTAAESLVALAELSHFGPSDLRGIAVEWHLRNSAGAVIAAGVFPKTNAPTGALTPLGTLRADFNGASAPEKLTVELSLPGTTVRNHWEIWVYPAAPKPQSPRNVVATTSWTEAQRALGEGKRVLYFSYEAKGARSFNGRYQPVFWSPVWFPDQLPNTMSVLVNPAHAAFAQFPTEDRSNWQWYELMERSRVYMLSDFAPQLKPVVRVIDNFARNHHLGAVFEAKVGSGQLLVCGLDLLGLEEHANACQLLASLYEYAGSEKFSPKVTLSVEQLNPLFIEATATNPVTSGNPAAAAPGREYHVSPSGFDFSPGTPDAPIRSITAAMNRAQPGDTVIVHEGVYRERITPPRGGESDARRITYVAAPREKVVIKGSEIVRGWQRNEGGVWKVTFPHAFFGTENYFTKILSGDWFEDCGRSHRQGEIFLNEEPMHEAVSLEAVRAAPSVKRTWFCETDEAGVHLFANFGALDPNTELVEITVRDACFYPAKPGIDFITVRGFEMRHAATPWAPPTAEQVALIGTHWSRGWIIEDNILSDSKCAGLSLGKDRASGQNVWSADKTRGGADAFNDVINRATENGWSREKIGGHIVRRNTIHRCGQAGIVGSLGGIFSEITDNHVFDIATQRSFAGAEIAGIKLHAAIDTRIARNHIHNVGRGIWLDWMTQGTRVTANVLHDNSTDDLYIEVSHGPFLVDNNVFLSATALRDKSQGGAFAHNLFAGLIDCANELRRSTPHHAAHSTAILGRNSIPGGDHRWHNNLFLGGNTRPTDPQDGYSIERSRFVDFGIAGYALRPAPSVAAGNTYTKNARPLPSETNATLLRSADLKPRIVDENGETLIEFFFPQECVATDTATVTTALLGKTALTKLSFENADGTPLVLSHDLLGKRRPAEFPTVGPFESPGTEKVLLKVFSLKHNFLK